MISIQVQNRVFPLAVSHKVDDSHKLKKKRASTTFTPEQTTRESSYLLPYMYKKEEKKRRACYLRRGTGSIAHYCLLSRGIGNRSPPWKSRVDTRPTVCIDTYLPGQYFSPPSMHTPLQREQIVRADAFVVRTPTR